MRGEKRSTESKPRCLFGILKQNVCRETQRWVQQQNAMGINSPSDGADFSPARFLLGGSKSNRLKEDLHRRLDVGAARRALRPGREVGLAVLAQHAVPARHAHVRPRRVEADDAGFLFGRGRR